MCSIKVCLPSFIKISQIFLVLWSFICAAGKPLKIQCTDLKYGDIPPQIQGQSLQKFAWLLWNI